MFNFTFKKLANHYQNLQEANYRIVTYNDYYAAKGKYQGKLLVNRVDVDFSLKKAAIICDIFNDLDIKATFFIRLHASEYNPFDFESYKIIKKIIQSGHEIGYHSEIIDLAAIWGEDPAKILKRDLKIFETMLDFKIYGIASHGGMTGLNNLDFWKQNKPSDFGIRYEAYENSETFNLFTKSFYISDSEWTKWKCYDGGKLLVGDTRDPTEHIVDEHPLISLLIHPDTYYWEHFYE